MYKIVYFKPNNQENETWMAIDDDKVIGHISMKIEIGNKIKFLDAWIHPNHRRLGIYRELWETRWIYVTDNYKNHTIYAWCKDNSLSLLIEKGFELGEVCTYVEKKI